MESISKDTIITLNNNENYFVTNTIEYNGLFYALLINVNKDNDYMIVKERFENSKTVIEKVEDEIDLSRITLLLRDNLD